MTKSSKRNTLRLLVIPLFFIFCFSIFKILYSKLEIKWEQDKFDRYSALVSTNITELNEKSTKINQNNNSDSNSDLELTPLPQYLPIYEQNHDFYGWIRIDNTKINYPVMYTPDDPEFYLHRSFDGINSKSGTPFIDGDCLIDSNHLLIHGHNMKNDTMFSTLINYSDINYYIKHSIISFDTLYEQQNYKIIAAFYSRLYKEDEINVFRYYQYQDLTQPNIFDEYISEVKAASIYDTGVDSEYGDQIITMSTCSYHVKNGRFVVVAKKINT